MIDAALSTEERRVILVDGFNVLHAVLLKQEREAGWWRRGQRERLLQRVALWPSPADQIWVAFDGAQPAWSVWAEPVAKIVEPLPVATVDRKSAPLAATRAMPDGAGPEIAEKAEGARAIVHSVYMQSADDWIVRRARRAASPDRTIIVSADRQVTGRARSAGCEVWSPWTFMSQCPDDSIPSDLPDAASAPRSGTPSDVSDAPGA